MTWTQTTLTLKDAAGASQPIVAYTDGTNFSLAHPLLDNAGAIISPATQGTLASVLSALQAAVPAGNNVIGQVTANAGTNLNTSTLALETGGNLAMIAASQGTGGTGITQPTGGGGILGWLSGIFNKINTSIAVTGTFWQTTQPVSGTVTANAGTNLNTSALALETGGNLATAATNTGNISTAAGTTADAIVAAGAAGSISAKLRRLTQGLEDLKTSTILGAGSNTIGNIGTVTTISAVTAITNALPAGSNVLGGVTEADGANASLGAKADSAATTDIGTFSLIALFKRSLQTLASILTACQAATPAGTNLIGKVGFDQTTPGTTNLVYLPAPNIVAGSPTTRSANTTAYGAGQLVNAGTVVYPTIAAARANDLAGTILRLRLKKSSTTLTNGIFRVHLYSVQPTASNADGGVFLTTTSGYVGSFDVTMTMAFSDSAMGIGVPTAGSGVAFAPATGTANLYYLIESRAAYTPTSAEVFTPYVEVA